MKLQKKNAGVPQEAKTEERFSAYSFLEEIAPLLREYFFGEFVLESRHLSANFPNGQKFEIYISSVK